MGCRQEPIGPDDGVALGLGFFPGVFRDRDEILSSERDGTLRRKSVLGETLRPGSPTLRCARAIR